MDDIVLVTVDCWRPDALGRMPEVRQATAEYQSRVALCSAAATNGVFPSILASQYYPQTYTDTGELTDDLQTLPQLLSDHGYQTGAFIASNPFLDKWADEFDTYWNPHQNIQNPYLDRIRQLRKLSLFKKDVPASDVAIQANKWFTSVDSPRFLWIHLMDPHSPYFPGLKRAADIGLTASYRAAIEFETTMPKTTDTLTDATQDQIQQLYWQCVKRLDTSLADILRTYNDATVLVLGDHGEEFDHGVYHHARPYEEVITVPFLTNWCIQQTPDEIRQLDLAPTLLDTLGVPIPDQWEGKPVDGNVRSQPVLNKAAALGTFYAAYRDESRKCIKAVAEDTGNHHWEFYRLDEDPHEQQNRYPCSDAHELAAELDEFLDRIDAEIDTAWPEAASTDVHSRLKELGYVD